jgi:hypothetical protein
MVVEDSCDGAANLLACSERETREERERRVEYREKYKKTIKIK